MLSLHRGLTGMKSHHHLVVVTNFFSRSMVYAVLGKVSELQGAVIPWWSQAQQLLVAALLLSRKQMICVNPVLSGFSPAPSTASLRWGDLHRVLSFRHQRKVSNAPYGVTPLLQLTSALSSQCTIILPPHMSIHLLGSCYAACQIGFSKSTNTEAAGSALVLTPAFIPV